MAKSREMTEAESMIIIVEKEKGTTLRQLAKKFNFSHEGVWKIIEKVKKTGTAKNIPWSGRPRTTSVRDDRKLIRMVKVNPKISARELKESLNFPVAEQTIRNRLNEARFFGRRARNKPQINQKKSKKAAWVRPNLYSLFSFGSILWSDESRFEIRGDTQKKIKVCRQKNTAFEQKNIQPTVKSGYKSVLVWECFSYNGTGKLKAESSRAAIILMFLKKICLILWPNLNFQMILYFNKIMTQNTVQNSLRTFLLTTK